MYIAQPTHQEVKLQHNLQTIARKMRNTQTPSEQVLWFHLRNNKLGYKFRRQYLLYQFIVDFYCSAHKLVIEVDGPIHGQQQIHDQLRTDLLHRHGYTVLRFTNEDIQTRMDDVLQKIQKQLLSPARGELERGKG